MTNVIILAGPQINKDWNDKISKPLFRINGKMMLAYVIDAFRSSAGIGKIVVVGIKNELEKYFMDKADAIFGADEGNVVKDISEAARYLGKDNLILVCSSDLPMITAAAIGDFIARARAANSDFCYPVVDKPTVEKAFPELERTYIKVQEGTFAGGKMFAVKPGVVEKGLELADKVLEMSSNPIKIPKMLGIGFMLDYSMGTLTIEKVEKRFSQLSGVSAKIVVSRYPEIVANVDDPSDVIVATAHLSK